MTTSKTKPTPETSDDDIPELELTSDQDPKPGTRPTQFPKAQTLSDLQSPLIQKIHLDLKPLEPKSPIKPIPHHFTRSRVSQAIPLLALLAATTAITVPLLNYSYFASSKFQNNSQEIWMPIEIAPSQILENKPPLILVNAKLAALHAGQILVPVQKEFTLKILKDGYSPFEKTLTLTGQESDRQLNGLLQIKMRPLFPSKPVN